MGASLWNRGNVIVGIYGRWQGETINRDPEVRKTAAYLRSENRAGAGASATTRSIIANRSRILPYVAPARRDSGIRTGYCKARPFTTPTRKPTSGTAIGTRAIRYPIARRRRTGSARPYSVGLLTLRRDGFGYLSKHRTVLAAQPGMQRTDTAGGLLSQSVTLEKPSRLLMNIDQVADVHRLEVSLVDDAEQPLPGFEPVKVVESGLARAGEIRRTPRFPRAEVPGKIRWPDGEANPRFYALYLVPN